MKALALLLLFLFPPSTEQATTQITNISIATVGDLRTTGGFVDICGRKVDALSPANAAAMKTAPASDFPNVMYRAMNATLTDRATCVAYLVGLIDGWKEGHEHGVMAAHFPSGVPRGEAEKAAVALLPSSDLRTMSTAMHTDAFCIPDHLTTGGIMDVTPPQTAALS